MTERSKKGFAADFKRFFFRGLVTLLPTVLTIVLLVKCFEFVQDNIGEYITNGAIYVVVPFVDYPSVTDEEIENYRQFENLEADKATDTRIIREIRRAKLSEEWNNGPRAIVGFVLAMALVYIIGRLLASYLGHKLWYLFEQMVQQIPGFKQVYPHVKQVIDYLFGEHKIQFSRVVAVPYPRQGIYSIGLVTGAGFKHVRDVTGEQFVTVFIPSSPTPFTGYVIYVKTDEVIDLPITIEEALRFAVSGGVIVPDRQTLPRQFEELGTVPPTPNDDGAKGTNSQAAAVAAGDKTKTDQQSGS